MEFKMLISNETFPDHCKPRILFVEVTVSYYPMKYREKAKLDPTYVKKQVKSFKANHLIGRFHEDGLLIDGEAHEDLIKEAWKQYGPMSGLKEQFAWISSITVIKDLGRTNYEYKPKQNR